MSVLSDYEIMAAVDRGELGIDPYDSSMVQPASVDLRLDHHFRLFDGSEYSVIDPAREQIGITYYSTVNANQIFYLSPGEFALANTFETVSIPDNLCARLEGKSSLGRLGLLTHVTAGYIDPGFHGQITLELYNCAPLPIALYPGMKIAQLSLMRMSLPPMNPYGAMLAGSRYQGQSGPTPSRSHLNFTVIDTREGRHSAYAG